MIKYKNIKNNTLCLSALCMLAIPTIVSAHGKHGYILDKSEKSIVVSSSGDCWQTTGWKSGDALPECGGKVLDTDNDGVPDNQDKCPTTPVNAPVNISGCQVDSDRDGVFDQFDQCLKTPPNTRVAQNGCALVVNNDSDNDGVMNQNDRCPTTPVGVSVDATGCNNDNDADGVLNQNDQCPTTKTGVTVDATGCNADWDNDGVNNSYDRCANTPANTRVNNVGCALERKLVLKDVEFPTNSSVLNAQYKAILDSVYNQLQPYMNVVKTIKVKGFTDSRGAAKYNLHLSKRRAKSVKDYLIGKGIPASLIQSSGYGKENPIANNDTSVGRAKNRRVEIHLDYK